MGPVSGISDQRRLSGQSSPGRRGRALLDGAYLRLPFPTCWCFNRLPELAQREAEAIYRSEPARGCPAAQDDAVFEEAMLDASIHWTIQSVSWTLSSNLEKDQDWGLATLRQRHLFRLEALVRQAERAEGRGAIRETAANLARALRSRWPETAELPLYPAFRQR